MSPKHGTRLKVTSWLNFFGGSATVLVEPEPAARLIGRQHEASTEFPALSRFGRESGRGGPDSAVPDEAGGVFQQQALLLLRLPLADQRTDGGAAQRAART